MKTLRDMLWDLKEQTAPLHLSVGSTINVVKEWLEQHRHVPQYELKTMDQNQKRQTENAFLDRVLEELRTNEE